LKRTITTGCGTLDLLLDGGLLLGEVVLIYGEAETGKTTLAMQCAINAVRMGLKTLYVDSDGTFSPARLTQIAKSDWNEVASYIMVFKPQSFEEQADLIDHLHAYLRGNTRFLVVDTITTLYRLEVGSKKETFNLNRELNRQLAFLVEITRRKNITTLLTSQVRSVPSSEPAEKAPIEPVGTRVLRFWTDKVLKFERTSKGDVISVSLEKPAKHNERMQGYFRISDEGIKEDEGDTFLRRNRRI